MGELLSILISIIEIMILGLFSIIVSAYFVATLHPLKNKLFEYYRRMSSFLFESSSMKEYKSHIVLALMIGCIYYGGILINIVDYWFLEPLHFKIINEVENVDGLKKNDQIVITKNKRESIIYTIGKDSTTKNTTSENQDSIITITESKDYLFLSSNIDSSTYNKNIWHYAGVPIWFFTGSNLIGSDEVKSYKYYVTRSMHWGNNDSNNAGDSVSDMQKFIRLIRGTLFLSFIVGLIAIIKIIISLVVALICRQSEKKWALYLFEIFIVEKSANSSSSDRKARSRVAIDNIVLPNMYILIIAIPIYLASVKSYVVLEREFHITINEGDNTVLIKEEQKKQ